MTSGATPNPDEVEHNQLLLLCATNGPEQVQQGPFRNEIIR
jgi:hypothetical protein